MDSNYAEVISLEDEDFFFSDEVTILIFEFTVFSRTFRDLWRTSDSTEINEYPIPMRTARSMQQIIRKYLDTLVNQSDAPLIREYSGISSRPLIEDQNANKNSENIDYMEHISKTIEDKLGYTCFTYIGSTYNIKGLIESIFLLKSQGIPEQKSLLPKGVLNPDRYDQRVIESILNPRLYASSLTGVLSNPEIASRIFGLNYTLNRRRSTRLG